MGQMFCMNTILDVKQMGRMLHEHHLGCADWNSLLYESFHVVPS